MLQHARGFIAAAVLVTVAMQGDISPAMAGVTEEQSSQELLSTSDIPNSYLEESARAKENGASRVRFIAPSRIVGITDNGGGKSNTAAELLIVEKTGVSHQQLRRDALSEALRRSPEQFLQETNVHQRTAGFEELIDFNFRSRYGIRDVG